MKVGQILTIEDDDGFTTMWPWPDDRLALANASFVELMEAAHDRLRAERSQIDDEAPK